MSYDTADEMIQGLQREVRDLEVEVDNLRAAKDDPPRAFDAMIGRLDRVLSEFLSAARSGELDDADIQTIKHHADDLIGVGKAALEGCATTSAKPNDSGFCYPCSSSPFGCPTHGDAARARMSGESTK
jgi:hypothetical protein